MDLFEVINGKAFPSVHALLIEPFKSISANDLSPDKGDSINIFTYVELVCSPKKSNPFLGYSEEDRPSKVKEEVWGDNPPDDPSIIIEAVLKYKELLNNASPSYELFNAALVAKDKLVHNLKNFDLDERTNGGAAVTKPKDITSALKEVGEVARGIELMRGKVHAELAEDSKTRSQREIGEYER